MRLLRSPEDIEAALDALVAADPRLAPVRAAAGPIPPRRLPGGFAGLASVVVSQQVSTASAAAIFGRLQAALDPLTPQAALEASDDLFRAAGLSAAKVRTLRAAALAAASGLDLGALGERPTAQALAELIALPGIGPWTAQSYLLFAAGHADLFPARDVALQTAVGRAFGLPRRPDETALAGIAAAWTPWRSAAARLFWAYYRTLPGRDGAPAA